MEKIKTRLCVDGPVTSVKGKLEALKRQTACGGEAWAKTWRQWTKAMVKSKLSWDRWTNRSHDDVKWIISFNEDQAKCWLMMMIKMLNGGWCLCGINILGRWKEMCKAKIWLVGHFISPVKGYVEKCMTGFRIDSRTIKRSKLVCISVI